MKIIDKWWTSLPAFYKELASSKPYPECTTWWLSLSDEQKKDIRNMRVTRIEPLVRSKFKIKVNLDGNELELCDVKAIEQGDGCVIVELFDKEPLSVKCTLVEAARLLGWSWM